MNKLESLRYFCSACETLNFRETAQRMGVSPQVVTRIIAELEELLGETLFKRNTRNIILTEFGQKFLPKATQYLADGEKLFASSKISENTMRGVVRITLPPMPYNDDILFELLTALEPYPELAIDWQVAVDKLKTVEDQIDIGLRICHEPEPNWVAKHICTFREKIVTSPALIKRLGSPNNLQDLAKNYPLSGFMDNKLKRIWHWHINDDNRFMPNHTLFFATDINSELQAALAGRTCSLLVDCICNPYLENGRLVELFPSIKKQQWQLYLYRPYQTIVSDRVLWVYEKLKEILLTKLGE